MSVLTENPQMSSDPDPSSGTSQHLLPVSTKHSKNNSTALRLSTPSDRPRVRGAAKPKSAAKKRHRRRILTPFGNFAKLPPEIRILIWQYLAPEFRAGSEPPQDCIASSPRSGNRLSILRTSWALLFEVQKKLYGSRVLCITIRPERRGWRVENCAGSSMADFTNTNFARFESIRVEISCPSSHLALRSVQHHQRHEATRFPITYGK